MPQHMLLLHIACSATMLICRVENGTGTRGEYQIQYQNRMLFRIRIRVFFGYLFVITCLDIGLIVMLSCKVIVSCIACVQFVFAFHALSDKYLVSSQLISVSDRYSYE